MEERDCSRALDVEQASLRYGGGLSVRLWVTDLAGEYSAEANAIRPLERLFNRERIAQYLSISQFKRNHRARAVALTRAGFLLGWFRESSTFRGIPRGGRHYPLNVRRRGFLTSRHPVLCHGVVVSDTSVALQRAVAFYAFDW